MSNALTSDAQTRPQSPSNNPNGWVTRAFKWSSEELYRAAEAVEEMLASPGWQAVQRLVSEGVDFEQKNLFRLMARNQIEAAQIAGRMEGLNGASAAADGIRTAAASMRDQLEAANAAKE